MKAQAGQLAQGAQRVASSEGVAHDSLVGAVIPPGGYAEAADSPSRPGVGGLRAAAGPVHCGPAARAAPLLGSVTLTVFEDGERWRRYLAHTGLLEVATAQVGGR